MDECKSLVPTELHGLRHADEVHVDLVAERLDPGAYTRPLSSST